jgi:hypothetical protein
MLIDNSDGTVQIVLVWSRFSNYDQFPKIAEIIVQHFKGEILNKYDMFDSRWWNFKVNDKLLSVGHHDLVGLTICSETIDANEMAKEVERFFRKRWNIDEDGKPLK